MTHTNSSRAHLKDRATLCVVGNDVNLRTFLRRAGSPLSLVCCPPCSCFLARFVFLLRIQKMGETKLRFTQRDRQLPRSQSGAPAPNYTNASHPWHDIGYVHITWRSRPTPGRKASSPAPPEPLRPCALSGLLWPDPRLCRFPPGVATPNLEMGSDINSKTKAWEWMCKQIFVGALHPQ